jgi:hypothetical protein
VPPIPIPTRPNRRRQRPGVPLAAWTAITLSAVTAAARPSSALLAEVTAHARRRVEARRGTRDSGLTTVEVAIITAVLLGLATALVAAITVVVTRNTGKIK